MSRNFILIPQPLINLISFIHDSLYKFIYDSLSYNHIQALSHLTVAPKGIKASFAILKCCRPKGIPTTVMHKSSPNTADSTANGIPVIKSQIIFNKREPAPPPYSTSLPKGKKLKLASLKHCMPTGMPTMVMHHRHPAISQLNPLKKPPHMNHIILPRHPII